ncbi:MAG: 1,4-dihydroxy-6-naphthoate synthase [Geobacteraceae bacterium]|nr:1,4-dihydroxy-6-naphthoate synthase [Geobacteraceae bacterium]
MKTLTLGFSPCPNDTFIFYALAHKLLDTASTTFRFRMEDVQTLNHLAKEDALDVCKVSWHAYAHIRERYVMLRAGGAMGKGCGPLVVARNRLTPTSLRGARIAVPGIHTTALLLLRLFDPEIGGIVTLPFHRIMEAIAQGTVDAGLIIHESRFTFQALGLHKVVDLGEWWEGLTGLPIPLGGIAARRSLGPAMLSRVNDIIRASAEYALRAPAETENYVALHAREMDATAREAHIRLYVNEFSLDPGRVGEKAARTLLDMGEKLEVLPPGHGEVFLPSGR